VAKLYRDGAKMHTKKHVSKGILNHEDNPYLAGHSLFMADANSLSRWIVGNSFRIPDSASAPLFFKALSIAKEAYFGRTRKDGQTPEIVHPIETALLTDYYDLGRPSIITALFHDLLEDFPGQYTYEIQNFGEGILETVLALTKESSEPYSNYIKRLSANKDALAVKICDRISNSHTELKVFTRNKIIRHMHQNLNELIPSALKSNIVEPSIHLAEQSIRILIALNADPLDIIQSDVYKNAYVNPRMAKLNLAIVKRS
jgi:GTP diphosphokinase / guanosine-3',5'-bis(diphosphate) 3'-diphosphatase